MSCLVVDIQRTLDKSQSLELLFCEFSLAQIEVVNGFGET